MNNLTNFFILTFAFGLVVSVFSLLVERLLVIYGFTRGNTIVLGIATFISAILKQLVYPNGSLFFFGLLLVIMGVLAGNRSDLTQTIQKGRWWWRSDTSSVSD